MNPKTLPTSKNAKSDRASSVNPHPSRTERILRWHLAQMQSPNTPVAALHLAVTACGQVKTSALAIEPEHALVMLAELDAIRQRLRQFLDAQHMGKQTAHIAPLIRRA